MKTLALALAILPVAAHAETQDIAWFMANQTVLRQTLSVCHGDARYSNTPTCENAEAASAGMMARNAPNLNALLSDQRYWSLNPIARDGFLMQCRQGTALAPAYCGIAARSAAQDVKTR